MPMQISGCAAVLLALAVQAHCQTPSNERTVIVPEVEVRSGPSPRFYATTKLKQGDKVTVVREEEGGWLAIKPPLGSFNWINKRVLERDAKDLNAKVLESNVETLIGNNLVDEPPTV